MKDFRNLYILSNINGLGAVRISKLIEKFGSAENIFNAGYDDMMNEGIDKTTARYLLNRKFDFEGLDKKYEDLVEKLNKYNAEVVTIENNSYPALLKRIYDPPVLLYYRGSYEKYHENGSLKDMIGIVGTRTPSDYGRFIAKKIASELSDIGLSIISGFARGIDTCAHQGSIGLKNNESISIAVLGCGVDKIYPPENKILFGKMLESGLILSEYEIGTEPDAVNFPKRNRIISGMSHGVVIVESGKNGGALITARYALDQSREVYAVPGFINNKTSEGPNELIKNGQAKLIQNVEDIIIEIENKLTGFKNKKIKQDKTNIKIKLQDKDKKIYDYLSNFNESVDIDSISENTGLSISDSLVSLLNLEFKGVVKQLPGKRFILN